jgi:hypothetical protein
MTVPCPGDGCNGRCTERQGDWWECSVCENWFPGAYLRLKGILGKTAKKSATKTKRKTQTKVVRPVTKTTTKPPKAKRRPKPRGIRRPRI